MLEEVLKALVASMTDLAKSNRELATAFTGSSPAGILQDVVGKEPEAAEVAAETVEAANTILNLDEIDPAELFLLAVVHGDKALTTADLEDIRNNPPTKKLVDIANKINKAFESRQVKAKYFGHVLVEFALMFVDTLDTLKTQKDFNEFWKQVEFSKPDERAGLKYTPAAAKAKDSVVVTEQTGVEVEEMELDDAPDYETLRKKGAAMIGDAAKANRPALVELLKTHNCVTPENKISFAAAADAVLPVLVPAIEALLPAEDSLA